jgi:major membrane immunogen (membrane-anchored lipoprotein)
MADTYLMENQMKTLLIIFALTLVTGCSTTDRSSSSGASGSYGASLQSADPAKNIYFGA